MHVPRVPIIARSRGSTTSRVAAAALALIAVGFGWRRFNPDYRDWAKDQRALWWRWQSSAEDREPPLPAITQATARALATSRPVALRLTGSTVWSECRAERDSTTLGRCTTYSPGDGASRIRDARRRVTTPAPEAIDSLWASALVDLASDANTDRLSRAVEALETVVLERPTIWRARSDLAVAYCARAEMTGDPTFLFMGLDEVERAYQANPASDVVRFNRALILERLSMDSQARRAWQDYHRLGKTDDWSAEAAAHLRRLETVGAAGRSWSLSDPARDPLAARDFISDSLIPRWAGASPSSTSEARLDSARVIAEALSRTSDSSMLHVVRSASHASARARMEIDRASRAYLLFRRGKNELALPEMQSSARALRTLGATAIADWTDVHASTIDVYAGRYDRAEQRLHAIASAAQRRGDLALRGRALWILALLSARKGAEGTAASLYAEAASLFGAIGERANQVAMLSQRADVDFILGRDRQALQGHSLALAELRVHRAPARRAGTLLDLARELDELGLPFGSIALLREAVDNAPATGREIDRSEAAVRLTHALIAQGLTDSGRVQLLATRQAARGLTDSIARKRIQAEMAFADALLIADAAPVAAIARLDTIIDFYNQVGLRYGIARYLIRRARLNVQAADSATGEADLDRAVGMIESYRTSEVNVADARQAAAASREAFDQLIDIRIARHDTIGAFLLAERSRGNRIRTVPEPRHGRPILSLVPLPGKLASWVVSGTSVRMVVQPLRRDDLETRVQLFENDLRRGSSGADSLSRWFFARLIAPVEHELRDAAELTIVADGVLGRLPFALLRDGANRSLIEKTALSYATAVRASEPEVPSLARPYAIENPEFDPSLFPGLEALRAISSEVAELRRLYPTIQVIGGKLATKSAMIDALRSATVLHFSGHAQRIAREPELSHLVLAPSGSAFDANVLTAQEIRALPLHQLKLVVLAACGTSQRISTRDDGQAGLASAFLDAGAGAVISSVWDVDDQVTADLMAALHRNLLAGQSPAAALRSAQIDAAMRLAPSAAATWGAFRVERR